MKVWITKYALTSGIEFSDQAEASASSDRGITMPVTSRCMRQFFWGDEWHTSFDAAMVRVEKMIARREKSLRKSLAKLQTLQFVDPAPADGEAGLSGDAAGE